MLRILFNLYLFIHINSYNLINLTQNYSKKSEFKTAIFKKESNFFFVNTIDKIYKSSTLDGSIISNISLNFSDNSSIIYIPKKNIFVSSCTKDYFLGIIYSNSNTKIIVKENKIEGISNELKVENKCNLLYNNLNENDEKFNVIFAFSIKIKDFNKETFKYKFFVLDLNKYNNTNNLNFNDLVIEKKIL